MSRLGEPVTVSLRLVVTVTSHFQPEVSIQICCCKVWMSSWFATLDADATAELSKWRWPHVTAPLPSRLDKSAWGWYTVMIPSPRFMLSFWRELKLYCFPLVIIAGRSDSASNPFYKTIAIREPSTLRTILAIRILTGLFCLQTMANHAKYVWWSISAEQIMTYIRTCQYLSVVIVM